MTGSVAKGGDPLPREIRRGVLSEGFLLFHAPDYSQDAWIRGYPVEGER